MNFLFFLNKTLGFVTFLIHIALISGGVYFFLNRKNKENFLLQFVAKNGILLAFFTALAATLLSLYYSEIAGFVPCVLCWWQRIFIYPQVLLLALAIYKKENSIVDYALLLTFVGGLIALYHTYISYGGAAFLPCGADGISCTRRYVYEFGYITIPLMSLTSFLMTGAFLGIKKYYTNQK